MDADNYSSFVRGVVATCEEDLIFYVEVDSFGNISCVS
jgi:hypothetical protein